MQPVTSVAESRCTREFLAGAFRVRPGTFNTFSRPRVMSMEMEETDAELVLGVRRGDRRAAGRLLERYMRACRAVALAVTGSEADADDVCQDGFVIAIERIDSCRDPARFGGWLLQIVRNRARNLLRDRGLRETLALDEHTPAGSADPEAAAERGELRARLRAALGTLPEQQREVVLLHDLEGWKHREIAERLDLPAGTVRSHLHHARRRLREILGVDADR
jgi:RNA polymerase sigma-70 factor (ECF subfamily)